MGRCPLTGNSTSVTPFALWAIPLQTWSRLEELSSQPGRLEPAFKSSVKRGSDRSSNQPAFCSKRVRNCEKLRRKSHVCSAPEFRSGRSKPSSMFGASHLANGGSTRSRKRNCRDDAQRYSGTRTHGALWRPRTQSRHLYP